MMPALLNRVKALEARAGVVAGHERVTEIILRGWLPEPPEPGRSYPVGVWRLGDRHFHLEERVLCN